MNQSYFVLYENINCATDENYQIYVNICKKYDITPIDKGHWVDMVNTFCDNKSVINVVLKIYDKFANIFDFLDLLEFVNLNSDENELKKIFCLLKYKKDEIYTINDLEKLFNQSYYYDNIYNVITYFLGLNDIEHRQQLILNYLIDNESVMFDILDYNNYKYIKCDNNGILIL